MAANLHTSRLLITMASLAAPLLALPLFLPAITRAQATSRTFPETGKTVQGRFLDYWSSHGGLAQQGKATFR